MNLGQQFSEYKEEAFRLECLLQYRVAGEWDDFQHYLKTGEVKDSSGFQGYLDDAQRMISSGRRHIRSRMLPEAIPAYIEFEAKLSYFPLSRVGAEILFIEHDHPKVEQWRKVSDFWLFDKSRLFLMKYTDDGQWAGADYCDDQAKVNEAIAIRNDIVNTATSLSCALDKYNKLQRG